MATGIQLILLSAGHSVTAVGAAYNDITCTPPYILDIAAILLPPPPYTMDMDILALYHLHTPWTQPYSPLALVSDCEKDDRKHRS